MEKIDCKNLSERILNDLENKINDYISIKRLRKPKLAIITVGNDEGNELYVRNKKRLCNRLKIDFEHIQFECLDENECISNICDTILKLNDDDSIDGILLQLPLVGIKHYKYDEIISKIADDKDIDGFKENSEFMPCTPKGIVEVINNHFFTKNLNGKNVVLLGSRSKTTGRYLVDYLIKNGATLICCNSYTSTYDMMKYLKNADIVISCVGKNNLFDVDMLESTKLPLIVDVGISRINNKQIGDFSHNKLDKISGFYTPWVNGIGLMTTTMLMSNIFEAYKKHL